MKVQLTPVDIADMEQIRAWRNLPEIMKWGFTQAEIEKVDHGVWFRSMLADVSKVYWKIVVDGSAVGSIFLTQISSKDAQCSWGMYLADQDLRGKGVAQAACALSFQFAFNALSVERVLCEAVAQNETAIGLYESVGYVRTGLKEGAVMRGNEMLSVVTLELTRDAWNAREEHVLQRLSEKGVNIHG